MVSNHDNGLHATPSSGVDAVQLRSAEVPRCMGPAVA